MTTDKIMRHLSLIRNAYRFRVPFVRHALFSVPKVISINGKRCKLEFPDELGIKNDFLACVIEDVYGLRKLGSSPQTILDIGANVGFFSMAARSFFPKALIHAYEPNRRIMRALANQASIARFQYFPEALGSRAGTVEIIEEGDSNLARTELAQKGSIIQISLNEAIERMGGFVDVAKIDCEGAEWNLFQAPDCWNNISQIRMEYHLWGKRSFAEVIENMDRLGFEIIWHDSRGESGILWAVKRN